MASPPVILVAEDHRMHVSSYSSGGSGSNPLPPMPGRALSTRDSDATPTAAAPEPADSPASPASSPSGQQQGGSGSHRILVHSALVSDEPHSSPRKAFLKAEAVTSSPVSTYGRIDAPASNGAVGGNGAGLNGLLGAGSRSGTDKEDVISAFAQGDKNMSSLARGDFKNRWLVSFSFKIFVEVLFVHVFGPLSVPYMYARYGKWPIINMQLHNFYKLPGAAGNVIWSMWVLGWFCYIYFDTPNITLSELVMATFITMARNCIIAAKYAYFSPGQLSDMQKRAFSAEEQTASLLGSGWPVPTRTTQRNELLYALKRTGVDLKHMRLLFAGDDHEERVCTAATLKASFGTLLTEEDDRPPGYSPEWESDLDQGLVPGELLVSSLLSDCIKAHAGVFPKQFRWIMFATFVHIFIPSFVRLYQSKPFMGRGVEIFIAVAMMVVTLPNIASSISFVTIGILDYDRRVWLMHQCSAMLSPQYRIYQTAHSKLLPMLSLERPTNIAHWLDIRMVLKDWGWQYFQRIQIYSSLWLFFLFGFIIYLFSSLIFERVTEPTSVILVVWDLGIVSIALFYMLDSAKTLNAQHIEHRRILLRKLHYLQRCVSGCIMIDRTGQELSILPKQIKEMREAKEMLAVVIQVMETEDEVQPIKILGMRASENVLRGAIGVAGSAFIASAKLLMG